MKINLNILIRFIPLFIFFCSLTYGQPYIYIKEFISFNEEGTAVQVIKRFDLNNNYFEIFDDTTYNVDVIMLDNLQEWLFSEIRNSNTLVENCIDPNIWFELPEDVGGIGRIINSKGNNKLFIFSSILGKEDIEKLIMVDLNSIITTYLISLPFNGNRYNSTNEEAFLSGNENIIYFVVEDTTYLPRRADKDKVNYFSTTLNKIVQQRDLSELGFPNSDGYILHRGRKGISIIQSFFWNETKDSYFRIYNFDTDSGSNFIKYQGNAEPYFLNEGKYLVLAKTEDSADVEYYNGIINIYEVTSGTLIKVLNLPPKGKIYVFDNYPNMLYYYLEGEHRSISIDINKIIQKFELNINIIGNGTVEKSPPQTEYDSSTTVTLTAKPSPGYTFREWSGDITGTNPTVSVVMNSNKNITATFIPAASSGLTVKLINSSGELLTGGTLQYYEGSWKNAVNNNDGTFTVNTTRSTISLRMTYEYGSQTKQDVPVGNGDIIFQSVKTQVKLQDSNGSNLDQGTVQYYAGAWRSFGTTSNGIAEKELLPANYSFRMTYAYASNDKKQEIGTDPNVIFQTVNAEVQLQNNLGNLMDQGTVQYYSGAWREFGATNNGIVHKELLPNNYSFRMSYAFASTDKQQNLNDNPVVVFKTINTQVQLKNSLGNLIDGGSVQYYSGAWRSFGATTGGTAVKELLPGSYSFRMTHEFVSNDKKQDISTNNTVEFSTVLCTIRVKNTQNQPVNNAQASYYSGAWRVIGNTVNGEITKELLPTELTFRAKLGTKQADKKQNIAENNEVEVILP